jgi:glutathione synthase/RimK-type ligase-like ATP-grasp enzyme
VKRILIIGSKRVDASTIEPLSAIADYVKRTVEAEANDIEVQHCQVDELVHVLDGPNATISVAQTGEALESFDFVWFRGKLAPSLNELGIVTQYLQRKNVRFANHSYADRAPFGKLAQMHMLSALDLPYPKTVSTIAEFMPAAIAREFTYPIILKAIHAGHGHSNYLVRDEQHLRELLAAEPDTVFVAQTYIANDGDYRLLIVGDQELIILRKGSEDSHLNNTSQGGAATLVSPVDFPASILADARKFAAACNYAIAGVDVMFGSQDGKPYFLEANSQPQLMSGAFTDEKAVLVKDFFLKNLG